MNRFVRLASVICLCLYQLCSLPVARAESVAQAVVISQLSTGDAQSGNNEFVELYNNSDNDVDISNWCIRYATAADSQQTSPKYCFAPSDSQTKIYLSTRSYAVIVTPSFVMPSGTSPDGRFTGSGMADAGGHISLFDSGTKVIDKVGWGAAVRAEGYQTNAAPSKPTATLSLTRKVSSGNVLQDTDINKTDFELKAPLLHGGGVYELRTPVDICGNLSGIQETLPGGYGYDEAGNCEALANDVCTNIDKIQITIPDGMQQNSDGSCHVPPADSCLNLAGLQVIVPDGYIRSNDNCLKLEDRSLWLSEIMPNVAGSDTGHEFIELYNPYDEPIALNGYTLMIGKSFEKSYPLPALADRVEIGPHSYVTYTDSELGASLLNTYSGVRLVAPAGNTVSETAYSEPADDEAWAYIDGQWQYTDQATPTAPNQARLIEENDTIDSAVTACPEGKYRNPLTNRCRTIEADAAILADCQEGYYRNPETNRCRKVLSASATLTPCQTGYSRNEETNRCRKDGNGESTLTPCKAGQERNPATNRCRNATALTTPASIAEVQSQSTGNNTALPLIITVAAIGAVGYGAYEWRREVGGAFTKLLGRFKR